MWSWERFALPVQLVIASVSEACHRAGHFGPDPLAPRNDESSKRKPGLAKRNPGRAAASCMPSTYADGNMEWPAPARM